MKIGLIGAQGVGKTTLLNALAKEKIFKNFAICDEVTRWVKKFDFSINEDGDENTQELIAMKHAYNLIMHDNLLTDRTIIDCFVYSQFLKNRGQISESCLNDVKKVFHRLYPMYNYIFYIAPEFKIEDDGVRSTNLEFRNEIVNIFDDVLFENVNNYHVVSGSVKERVKRIKEIIIFGDTFNARY